MPCAMSMSFLDATVQLSNALATVCTTNVCMVTTTKKKTRSSPLPCCSGWEKSKPFQPLARPLVYFKMIE